MKHVAFSGLNPKTQAQKLGFQAATIAENLDLYGERLRAIRAPLHLALLTDVSGQPFLGAPKSIYTTHGITIGFHEHTWVARDPQALAIDDTFLFVQDGALWRSSPYRIAQKLPPIKVGIAPPCAAPLMTLLPGAGCVPPDVPLECIENSYAERPTQNTECVGTTACEAPYNPAPQQCNDGQVPEVAAYIFTYINEYSCPSFRVEESAPSPISTPMSVAPNDGILLSDPNTPPTNATGRRWYRATVTSDGQTLFLFVGQRPISDPTFSDTACPLELGEANRTENHYPPPPCVDGVAVLGDDVVVLWHGKHFWASEPKLPHAYNPRNIYEVLYDIVGIQGYTSFVESDEHYIGAILTKGLHYAVTADFPEKAAIREIQEWVACRSERSIIVGPGAVLFDTLHGPVEIAGTSIRYLLDEIMTEREWPDYSDDDIEYCYWDNRLYGFSKKRSWYFHFGRTNKERPTNFITLTLYPHASFAAPDAPMRLILDAREGVQPGVYLWGAGTHNLRWRWATKLVSQTGWWAPVAMKVVGDLDTVHGMSSIAKTVYEAWATKWAQARPDPIVFFQTHPEYQRYWSRLRGWKESILVRIASDRRVLYERYVDHREPFRLPSSFRDIDWAIEVSGHCDVWELHLQTSNEDLTQEGGHG